MVRFLKKMSKNFPEIRLSFNFTHCPLMIFKQYTFHQLK